VKINKCDIEGPLLIELSVLGDERGFFCERFNEEKFKKLGLPTHFVQDNHSRSAPGVLRGIHYQYSPAQGKLVGVTRGRIWDVAVDLRPDSKNFGKSFGHEISGNNGMLFWIPPGFGHGFCVIGDEPADVMYKVDALYNKDGEGGIDWNDPELAVKWPLKELTENQPVISERDKNLMSFAEYKKNPPRFRVETKKGI